MTWAAEHSATRSVASLGCCNLNIPQHESPAYYEFEGTGTITGLLSGIAPHKWASPMGIDQRWTRPLEMVARCQDARGARLQNLTRELDASLAIDRETCERAQPAAADFEKRGDVSIRGRRDSQDVYVLPLPADRS